MKYTPEFIEYLIEKYTERLASAKTIEERSFLRAELKRLKTIPE